MVSEYDFNGEYSECVVSGECSKCSESVRITYEIDGETEYDHSEETKDWCVEDGEGCFSLDDCGTDFHGDYITHHTKCLDCGTKMSNDYRRR